MKTTYTKHAAVRAQQRGIPPLIDQLLDEYGHEEHDGRGCVIRFLNKRSKKAMERDLGRIVVSRLSEWLGTYKVTGADGKTITLGHRTDRVWRH